MNISYTSIGTNHGRLEMHMEEKDLNSKIREKLKKIQKTSHIKGFRQGAAPESLIKKLYGDAVEAELIEKSLNEQIVKYQTENKLRFLGDLLPAPSDQEEEDLKNRKYIFEVGITPTFDLHAALNALIVDKLNIEVQDSMIQEEMEHMRTRYGSQTDASDQTIADNDYITLDAQELSDGQILDSGLKSTFSLLIDSTLGSEFKNLILDKNQGFEFEFDIRSIDTSLNDDQIRKYFLNIPDGQSPEFNSRFRFTIKEIKRQVKAELDETLYKSLYGPSSEYSSIEDFKQKIREEIEKYYASECDKILEIDINKKLNQELDLAFPDDFLRKWLRHAFEEWRQKSDSNFEHDLYHFKEGLTWQLIRDQISTEQNFKPSTEQVVDNWIQEFQSKYPGLNFPKEQWIEFAARALKEEGKYQQSYMNLINDWCFNWLKQQIKLNSKTVSIEEFREIVKKLNSHADHFHEEAHEESHAHA